MKSNRLLNILFSDFKRLAVTVPRWLNARVLQNAKRRVHPTWRQRTRRVLAAPDNRHIPRVARAGKTYGPWIILHNGIQVLGLGYYGAGMAHLLQMNRGVHEPQEERIFQAVLNALPENAVILELGAYWGFYSLWFLKRIPRGKAYLVEPDPVNRASGRINFLWNRARGTFIRGGIGERPETNEKGIRIFTVDELVTTHSIPFVHILHADIQGAELEMLKGARRLLSEKNTGYIFLSTHSKSLHMACESFLRKMNFLIIASIDQDESYSVDGILVAVSPAYQRIGAPWISGCMDHVEREKP